MKTKYTIKYYNPQLQKNILVAYPKVLGFLIRNCLVRENNNFDNVIIITGKVGSGKSNLAMGLSFGYEYFNGRLFSLENVFFTIEQVLEQLYMTGNETYTIIHDEAIQGSSSRDSTSIYGTGLLSALITKRYKKHLIILNIDNLKELNKKIIERSVCWIHCEYYRLKDTYLRGLFKIFPPNIASQVYLSLKSNKIIKPEEHKEYKKNKAIYKVPKYFDCVISEKEYESKKAYYTSENKKKLEEKIRKKSKKK